MPYSMVELIETKRDGGTLSGDAIDWLIGGYASGDIPDYQMSAMAMAVFLKGLDDAELAAWTMAMLHSGDVMDFSEIPLPKVDKHSTGGVGDKVSIPLAPLVAACGIAVPMMSGRGLGHTGGTLDKLESIPGFATGLDPATFRRILSENGLVLAGQSETMVPADRMLYALRDATATVPSIPLISSSIMSKKLAEGLDGLVLDVKTGSGAFMRELADSRKLAKTLVGIGNNNGVRTVALITSMEQPLGREVGNASEVKESIDVLKGGGPEDLVEITLAFAEIMLELGGVDGGRDRLLTAIDDGSALAKLARVIEAHGGDSSVIDDPTILPSAPSTDTVVSAKNGYVRACDALTIGSVATKLGAGRERKEDGIDHGVGITVEKKIGDHVASGEIMATVTYADEEKWRHLRDQLASAWVIDDEPVFAPALILERIS